MSPRQLRGQVRVPAPVLTPVRAPVRAPELPGLETDLPPGSAALQVAPPDHPGLVAVPSESPAGRWVDQPRTERLLDEVFLHRGDLPYWTHWPDRSTAYTPARYSWAYWSLAYAAHQQGDQEKLERYEARSRDWLLLAQ